MAKCRLNNDMSPPQLRIASTQLSQHRENAFTVCTTQKLSPSSSEPSDFFSLCHPAVPPRPMSPKYQHILDMSCPVSYPISYLRTPMPQPSISRPSNWCLEDSAENIREAVLPIWEGCLPDENVRESVEQNPVEVWPDTKYGGLCIVNSWNRTGLLHEHRNTLPSLDVVRKRLKRRADHTQDEGCDTRQAMEHKRMRS